VVPLDIVILPRRSRHVSEAMVVLTEPMQLEIVLSRNQQPMGRNVVAVAQASKMVRAAPSRAGPLSERTPRRAGHPARRGGPAGTAAGERRGSTRRSLAIPVSGAVTPGAVWGAPWRFAAGAQRARLLASHPRDQPGQL